MREFKRRWPSHEEIRVDQKDLTVPQWRAENKRFEQRKQYHQKFWDKHPTDRILPPDVKSYPKSSWPPFSDAIRKYGPPLSFPRGNG